MLFSLSLLAALFLPELPPSPTLPLDLPYPHAYYLSTGAPPPLFCHAAGLPTLDATGNSADSPGSPSPEFCDRAVSVARSIGVSPDDLLTVIAFETGSTFSPKQWPNGSIGLLSWTSIARDELGISAESLRGMTAIEQLDVVERTLEPFCGEVETLEQLYLAVLWPNAWDAPSNRVLHMTPRQYAKNAPLDLNDDGRITAGEATEPVRRLKADAERDRERWQPCWKVNACNARPE